MLFDFLGSLHVFQGIDRLRDMVQSVLDDRLKMWEDYCVRYTFEVPGDFLLPENVSPSLSLLPYTVCDCSIVSPLVVHHQDDQNIQPLTNDQELDAELDSLRRQLHLVRQNGSVL